MCYSLCGRGTKGHVWALGRQGTWRRDKGLMCHPASLNNVHGTPAVLRTIDYPHPPDVGVGISYF